jgi:16S rRNA (guanine527-N7)-methyltransferase
LSDLLKFSSICKRNGLEIDDARLAKLNEYVRLLLNWNTKINLISRNDISNVWYSHILHSISLLFFVEIQQNSKLLDLGTGGGLPGIPIAIVRSDLKITLLDSIKKKTAAVQDMVGELNMAKIDVVTGRAEEIGSKPEFARRFDAIISRAVAPLHDLIRWSRPFLRRSGSRLIALKGGDLDDELKEARIKSKPKDISVTNLVFDGSEEIGFEGKKIVTVYM